MKLGENVISQKVMPNFVIVVVPQYMLIQYPRFQLSVVYRDQKKKI
jgi:ubiquitin C-terminal hydrolase